MRPAPGEPTASRPAGHWDAAYARGDDDCSWTQARPLRSLTAIEAVRPPLDAPIVDVGGGSSSLARELLARGHTDVTVLDVSAAALSLAQQRLGRDAGRVEWIVADVLAWKPRRTYAIWHDRAVLHFFCDDEQRARYARAVRAALAAGGHAVIATFAPDGPATCSGLPVRRASPADVLSLLGDEFELVGAALEEHVTPSGSRQSFSWVTARRLSPGARA